MPDIKKTNRRLSREDWLQEALQILANEGNRLLTVERLCERLDVTRGSFYWHFKDRDEFLTAIIEYWEQRSTTQVMDTLTPLHANAEERLLKLIELISDQDFCKFELPIRIWATKAPATFRILQRMDKGRYNFVRRLFEEIGFSGDDLEMRTQTFVTYYSFLNGLSFEMEQDRDALLRQHRLRYLLLTSTPT